jgi:ribosomal-protein-alanine N-acetyltransferase
MLIPTHEPALVLRSWRLSDRDSLKDVADSGNIAQFMRDEFPHPYTKSAASEYLGEIGVPHADTHFALEWQGKVIGEIHFNPQKDILRHSCFLGYWVGEEYWGNGYMSSAVKTLVNWIFEKTELIRIVARVFANNFASIKVLEKNGFQQEGYFSKAVLKNGVLIDQVQYSLLKDSPLKP